MQGCHVTSVFFKENQIALRCIARLSFVACELHCAVLPGHQTPSKLRHEGRARNRPSWAGVGHPACRPALERPPSSPAAGAPPWRCLAAPPRPPAFSSANRIGREGSGIERISAAPRRGCPLPAVCKRTRPSLSPPPHVELAALLAQAAPGAAKVRHAVARAAAAARLQAEPAVPARQERRRRLSKSSSKTKEPTCDLRSLLQGIGLGACGPAHMSRILRRVVLETQPAAEGLCGTRILVWPARGVESSCM